MWTRLISILALLAIGCGEEDARMHGRSEPPAPRTPIPTTPPEPPRDEGSSTGRAVDEAAPAVRAPSRELRAERSRALRDGRRLARSGDHAGALARFRRGLEIDPEDATLLCEAGWAAFHANDAEAEALLRHGVSAHRSASGRAACNYNLGQLLEQRAATSDADEAASLRQEAIEAYARSLRDRPANAATRRRYEALAGIEVPCGRRGTFGSIDAFCARAPERVGEADGFAGCEREALDVAIEGEGIGELALISIGREYMSWTSHHLLLRRDGTWHELGTLGESFERSCSDASFSVRSVRWAPVAGALPTLVVDGRVRGSYACAPSPWERCVSEHDDESECEDESDEGASEEIDEPARFVCAEHEGRYRCSRGASALGETSSQTIPPEGALPAELAPYLTCSAFATQPAR